MIACIAKSDRGLPLFGALHHLDPRYVYLGAVKPSRRSLIAGALTSIAPSLAQIRLDAHFSPFVSRDMQRRCQALFERQSNVEAVLYWGAVNMPVDRCRTKVPYYIITDGPFDPDDASYPPSWNIQRWASSYVVRQRGIYSGAEHVFTLSEWARTKVMSVHNIAESRVTAIGWGPLHGIEAPQFEPPSVPYFISVGHDWHTKAMDIVSEAGSRFHQEHPEFTTLIIGKPLGFSVKPNKGIVLVPQSLPGVVVQSLIANAHALIVASRFDASPHVVYEALQCGTPVIGSNVCGIPEAISPPHGGIVIPKEDSDALLRAMCSILSSGPYARRRRAHATYVASGGWASCARKINEVVHRNTMVSSAVPSSCLS